MGIGREGVKMGAGTEEKGRGKRGKKEVLAKAR